MITYKVYEAEVKTTPTGKTLKKLVLQRDGAQHPTKNVTIWGDNPLYQMAVPGTTITCDLIETDSGVPNPNAPGKNYVNRTVANPGQNVPQSTTASHNVNEMAIKMHVTQEIAVIKHDLRMIAKHLGMEVKETSALPDYPEDLTEEDVPF